MDNSAEHVTAAIHYIEQHLTEKLDLDLVAGALHYSKFHLHRMFTRITGCTLHDYIQRRQLTEAAKLLVFSDKPILEIALSAGYESQQSFTAIFKAMYKKSPYQYRKDEEFYPLQLMYVLKKNQENIRAGSTDCLCWKEKIVYAEKKDIPEWMNLVRLVIDGFPHLHEEAYRRELEEYICRKRALMLKDGDTAVGIMLFNEETGSIDFLGVHPQYRKQGIAKAFLAEAFAKLAGGCTSVSITTFRKGDKADTGYREAFTHLGFAEAELMVEFGYPTQKLVLRQEKGGIDNGHAADK